MKALPKAPEGPGKTALSNACFALPQLGQEASLEASPTLGSWVSPVQVPDTAIRVSHSLLTRRTALLGGGLGAGTHTLLWGGVSHTLGCISFCSCLPRASTCWGTEVNEALVE